MTRFRDLSVICFRIIIIIVFTEWQKIEARMRKARANISSKMVAIITAHRAKKKMRCEAEMKMMPKCCYEVYGR